MVPLLLAGVFLLIVIKLIYEYAMKMQLCIGLRAVEDIRAALVAVEPRPY